MAVEEQIMERKTLVYQAYGIDAVLRQTKISIVSFLKNSSKEDALNILIYTDDENYFSEFFQKFNFIKIISINKDQIEKWRGPLDFVHRAKIEILKDAAARCSGALYY